MRVSGWLLLACSWGVIVALTAFCVARVLRGTPDSPGASRQPEEDPASNSDSSRRRSRE
jgi:hypothetical protein